MKRSRIWLSVATSAALVLAACGTQGGGDGSEAPDASDGGGEPIAVRLQLQWAPQAQFAGYFAAAGARLLRRGGPRRRDHRRRPGRHPAAGRARPPDGPEFTICWVPKVLEAREAGSDLVNIAQVFQRSGTLSVAWADSGITEPGRLRGQEGRRLGLRQRVRGHRRAARRGSRAGHRLRAGHPALRHGRCSSTARSTSPRR